MRARSYCPFYCEENVWHLARRIIATRSTVIFISNSDRFVTLSNQRNSGSWDYHVIFATCNDKEVWKIWDLDSFLEFPVEAKFYFDNTFSKDVVPRPLFRLVPAELYVSIFASDRRHMISSDGSYLKPEPLWPEIGTGFNLDKFIDMENIDFVGEVVDLNAVSQYLA